MILSGNKGFKLRLLANVLLVVLLLGAILPSFGIPQIVSASTLYESYTTGDNSYAGVWGVQWKAQTFTPSIAHTITSVVLLGFRIGSPGTVTVGIRTTDGNGHPTGSDLCSGTTNGNTLTTGSNGEWREITLGAGYELTTSTKYAIVVRATGGDINNSFNWRIDTISPSYTGGIYEYSEDSGSSWAGYAPVDMMFEEFGDPIISAPNIATNAASNIATTTARLNSTVVDDGGEACEVRWGYGESSESAIEDYDHFTNFAGSYTTGQHPYYDVSSLTDTTLYYFRVEIQNSEDTDLGDELDFTTLSSLNPPTNLNGVPSATSISLSWVKGAGSTNTMLRWKSGDYPIDEADGTQIYFSSGTSYALDDLSAGTTYYIRGWGESGDSYSGSYTDLLVTTSAAGAGGGEDLPASPAPWRWIAAPDYTNLSNLPFFYDVFNGIADALSFPRGNFWLLLVVLGSVGAGLVTAAISKGSGFASMLVGLAVLWFGWAIKLVPLYFAIFALVAIASIIMFGRREATKI